MVSYITEASLNEISVCPGHPLIINWSATAQNKESSSSPYTSRISKLLSKANFSAAGVIDGEYTSVEPNHKQDIISLKKIHLT